MQNKIKLSLVACLLTTTIVANENLGVITITSATKSEQSIKDVTSSVSVVTGIELEEKNIKTVTEALNLVSGISFTSNGGMGKTTSINLRGMGNNRTLILIDGMKFQDPSNTSGANIAHLMVTEIEKIEMIKGAQSGIWGADASAGVINIITKKPKDGVHGSILMEAGSFNTKKIAGTISYKNKKMDAKLSVTDIQTDGFTSAAPKGKDIDQYEDDGYENTTINLQSNYYINDNAKIGINITDIDAISQYDGWRAPNDSSMKSDVDSTLYGVTYNHILDKHNITIKVEKSDFTRDEIGTTFGVKLFEGETQNIEVNDNIQYNSEDFIVLGAGISSDDVDFSTVANTKNSKKNKDKYIYITNSNTIKNTIVTQSVRYDKYNNFDNKFTGKLGVKHNYSNDIYVSTNIGTAYNVPNIMQELNPWGNTNENLNPEDTKSADISFGYKDLVLTYFYSKVTDLIDWENNKYQNLEGKSTFKGLEVDYKKEILSDTLLSLAYTRLSAKNEDGEYLRRRAKDTFKFGIDYYGIDKLHIGLNGEYVGSRYENDDKKGSQTGRYTIGNLNINYDLLKNLKVYTKIENITDKYYQTIEGFSTSPRAYYAGVKYSF